MTWPIGEGLFVRHSKDVCPPDAGGRVRTLGQCTVTGGEVVNSKASAAGKEYPMGVNGGVKVGRVGGRLLSIGDQIVYRLPSFIGL